MAEPVKLDEEAMSVLRNIDKSLSEISKTLRGAYVKNGDVPNVGVLNVQVTNFDEAPR